MLRTGTKTACAIKGTMRKIKEPKRGGASDAPGKKRAGGVARERREAILRAATRVFFEKGYEAASMSGLIAEAGGSKATIYGYFQSKEKLFEEVIRQQLRELGRLLFDLPEETSNVEAALAEFGGKMVNLILDDTTQALKRICVHEACKFPELACVFFEDGAKMVITRLVDFIQRAHANGDLNAPDSEMAAWQFSVLCQAKYVHPCVILGKGKPTTEQIRTAIAAAVRTFMAAFGPDKESPRKSPRRKSA